MTGQRWRYFTAEALTGRQLADAVPLADVSFGPQVNGPSSLSAVIEPVQRRLHRDQLWPIRTVLYAERDGQVLFGGQIMTAAPEGPVWRIEAAGWWAHVTAQVDEHGNAGRPTGWINADPLDVVRDYLAYLARQPDADLGLLVDQTKTVARIGTAKEPITYPWWEAPMVGEVIDGLTEHGFEYTDTASWNADRSRIERRLLLGAPRLGRRRSDLQAASGVNIADTTPLQLDGDAYAQHITVLGAGEGKAMARAVAATRTGYPRRCAVVDRKDLRTKEQVQVAAQVEHGRRGRFGDIDRLVLRDHPYAPIGAINVGDELRVTVREDWLELDAWHRITAWRIRPQADEGAGDLIELELDRPA